jgi:hypothetical protein
MMLWYQGPNESGPGMVFVINLLFKFGTTIRFEMKLDLECYLL